MKRACLLIGSPGTGKTTIIKQVVNNWRGSAGGFYTEEIRAGGVRQGFRIVTLDGKSAILAHVNIKSPHRVSKYRVDVESLDKVGVSAIREATHKCEMVVIDEIGKMELFSDAFKEAALEAINSGKRVLGTIMLSSHPWADEIKRHPHVAVITLTRENRNQVLEQMLKFVESPERGMG